MFDRIRLQTLNNGYKHRIPKAMLGLVLSINAPSRKERRFLRYVAVIDMFRSEKEL